ncbi:MAG: MgtC/SapB family protein [Acidobacteriota bacterium]
METAVLRAFGEAFAIGLLVGVERYKDRDPGERKSAGIRTFTIFAVLGAVCGLFHQVAFTVMTLGALAILLVIGYFRQSAVSFGVTTEAAALLTFWLGYMVHANESLSITTAIVLVILLAAKDPMHEFVKEGVSETEFYDTLKFLAVVFVVYPLLPDRGIGPHHFLNPASIWLLIILVSTLSYSGYILTRLLGSGRGLKVSALLGGIVSTTAVTMSLAGRARRAPQFSRLCGVAAAMANAVQFPRLLLLISVVSTELGSALALPLLGMSAVGLLGARILARRGTAPEPSVELLLQNPYSFLPALKFGLLFVGVSFLAKTSTVWWGEQGIFLAAAVAGLGSASAIALSTAKLVASGSLAVETASTAILLAVAMNALFKWILALLNGNRRLAFWLGGGFATMLATGALLLLGHNLQ